MKQSSMETFAYSDDSLNQGDGDKNNKNDNKNHSLQKTKSFDDLKSEEVHGSSREKQHGSMDSDTFLRLTTQRAQIRENEEAVDRFFGADLTRTLDDNASMERVMREIIEKMHIKNSSWVRVNSGNSYQVTFSLETGVRCDDVRIIYYTKFNHPLN
jgi:cobalamin biosynthesis protein CobT